jgi:hypothetical protein
LQELQYSVNHPETVKATTVLGKILANGNLEMTLTDTNATEGQKELESGQMPSFKTTAELSKSGKFCSLLQKLNSSQKTN